LTVKISGNRGAQQEICSMEIVVHSKKSVSAKVLQEIVPFQQEFPT